MTKDPWWRTGRVWSQIQPQRGISEPAAARELAETQGLVFGGGVTRLNRSLSRWVNIELTSWGSLLNEVFNPHHARESRQQAQLVLNRGEKCKGKRQKSGLSWSAVWPRIPSYPEEASDLPGDRARG